MNKFLMTITRSKYLPAKRPPVHSKNPRKFMTPFDNRPIIQKQRKINEAHIEAALAMGLGWRIVGAT